MSMRSRIRVTLLVTTGLPLLLVAYNVASAPIPNPVIYLMRVEPYEQGGKHYLRYRYDVLNKDRYPAEMFAAAPNLPPCGTNTKSSRTWINVYDQAGKRLNVFCALTRTSELNGLWFALEETVIPPSFVYVEFTDRKLKKNYKSNLAETTP